MKPFWRGKGFSQVLYTLSLLFLALGLFTLGWAVWPAPSDAVQINIPAGALPGAPEGLAFDSLSEYELSISWPRWVRRGEVGLVHLRLTDLDHESTPTGKVRGLQVVLAEPSLFPLSLDPPGGVQANLGDDQELLLTWEVTGTERGSYPGKVYVSFGFYDDALVDLVEVPVAVVDLHIQVISLWGLEPGLVIWFGLLSLVLWGALFLLGRFAAG